VKAEADHPSTRKRNRGRLLGGVNGKDDKGIKRVRLVAWIGRVSSAVSRTFLENTTFERETH